MELPAVGVFIFVFFAGNNRFDLVPLFLLGIWQIHYLNRAFIFPFRIRSTTRQMPLVIPLVGIAFNTLNAYTNALWIGSFGIYAMDWIIDPRFLLGIALFFGGWIGNLHSDTMLRNLRRDNKIGYKIPNGKLFAGLPHPITCAKSSSGQAGQSQRGQPRVSPFQSSPQPISSQGP